MTGAPLGLVISELTSGTSLMSLAPDRSTVPMIGLTVWKMLGTPRSKSSDRACTAATAMLAARATSSPLIASKYMPPLAAAIACSIGTSAAGGVSAMTKIGTRRVTPPLTTAEKLLATTDGSMSPPLPPTTSTTAVFRHSTYLASSLAIMRTTSARVSSNRLPMGESLESSNPRPAGSSAPSWSGSIASTKSTRLSESGATITSVPSAAASSFWVVVCATVTFQSPSPRSPASSFCGAVASSTGSWAPTAGNSAPAP